MTNITLSAGQRAALKSALRAHPEVKAAGIKIVGTRDELLSLATRFNVPIPEVQPAADDFADDSDLLDKRAEAEAEAEAEADPVKTATDPDTLVQNVLSRLGKGDFEGFRTDLTTLAVRAVTPVKVVETVTVVETVEAAAPVTCTGHVPKKVGTKSAKDALGVSGPFGSLPLSIWDAPDAPRVDPNYVWPDETGAILSQLRRGQNIFLTGPAGTGKTSFARQLAAHTGRPYVRISCTEQTDAAAIVGMTVPSNGEVRWQDGQLAAAIRRPGTIILIDEPSTARPGALLAFQAVLDDERCLSIDETGERVPVADGVAFILADNTAGTGDETGAYEGTRRMNRATLDRCGITVRVSYLEATKEQAVLVKRAECTPALAAIAVTFANHTRAAADKGSLTIGVGLRRLVAWCQLVTDGVDAEAAFNLAMLNTATGEDRETLRQLFRAHVNAQDVRAARKA